MQKREMTQFLNEFKKELNIDFVRSDYGSCCRTCAEFPTEKILESFTKAKSFIICLYFTRGANNRGKFDEQSEFYFNWDGLSNKELELFKDRFESKFEGWKVNVPENTNTSIFAFEQNNEN